MNGTEGENGTGLSGLAAAMRPVLETVRRSIGVVSMVGLAVVLTIVASALKPSPAKGRRWIVVWHTYLGLEREALEGLTRRFNARNPQTPVRLLMVSFDNLPQKLTNAIPRGHGPDLFIFAHDRMGDWASTGLLTPLGFWVDRKTAGRFLARPLRALMYGPSLYALPLTYKSVALYYNKSLIGTPPKTTNELIAVGRKFTRPKEGKFGLVYEAADTYFHAPWHFGFGADFLKMDACPPKLAIRSRQAVEALRFARRLAGPGGIVPPEVDGQLVVSLFKSGRAAMAINGPWMLSSLAGGRLVRFGVAVLPVVSETKKPASPFLSVEGIFMNSRCRHKEAAFRFMAYLTSDRAALYRLKQARQLPANRTVDAKLEQVDPLLTAFRQQMAHARLTPATPMMRMLWQPFDKALVAHVARGEDPVAALKEVNWEVSMTLGACLKSRTCPGRPKGEKR